MNKNIIKIALKLSLIGVGLLILGYCIGWALYSYAVADLINEPVNYTSSELKVNDEAYNSLQGSSYQLQPSVNVIQPDMGYNFTGEIE